MDGKDFAITESSPKGRESCHAYLIVLPTLQVSHKNSAYEEMKECPKLSGLRLERDNYIKADV